MAAGNGSMMQIPTDVRGWLDHGEALVLAEYAAGKRVLEVGTWCGRSAITMALAGAHVDCVDTFQGDQATGLEDVLDEFRRNAERYRVADRIGIYQGDFRQVLPRLDLSVYEVAYLDAEHSYEQTRQLADLLLDRLQPRCVWIMHDVNYPQVLRVVHELMASMVKTLTVEGRMGVLH